MRIFKVSLGTVAVGIATLTASPGSAGQAAQSAQALFNTAQAAFERADWQGAIAGYRGGLTVMKPTSRSAPVVHSRLATALQHTGQPLAAEKEAQTSIRGFAAPGVTKDGDLAADYILLGDRHRGGYSGFA